MKEGNNREVRLGDRGWQRKWIIRENSEPGCPNHRKGKIRFSESARRVKEGKVSKLLPASQESRLEKTVAKRKENRL